MKYPIYKIKEVMQKKGYSFFENGTFNLNIIGVRSTVSESNSFDDLLYVIYKDNYGSWTAIENAITTDPGKPWLLNPLAGTGGTAVLVPGQYKGAYMVGIHGRSRPTGYKALEQKSNMKYVRDKNRDSKVDHSLYSNPANIFEANLKTNIHRASANSILKYVEKYSAGCQVFQDPAAFNTFIALCDKAAGLYGNSFTYTLLEEKDFS